MVIRKSRSFRSYSVETNSCQCNSERDNTFVPSSHNWSEQTSGVSAISHSKHIRRNCSKTHKKRRQWMTTECRDIEIVCRCETLNCSTKCKEKCWSTSLVSSACFRQTLGTNVEKSSAFYFIIPWLILFHQGKTDSLNFSSSNFLLFFPASLWSAPQTSMPPIGSHSTRLHQWKCSISPLRCRTIFSYERILGKKSLLNIRVRWI